tara:strand:- start:4392 stop:4670 length:279 start_codon:yes stop_codon:yes gene_type:complete
VAGENRKKIDMAITRKILKDKYQFKSIKNDKKVLTRKIGEGETIDVFGSALCFRGEVMATLECIALDSFDDYLEKLIRSIKKRNEIKSNKNK